MATLHLSPDIEFNQMCCYSVEKRDIDARGKPKPLEKTGSLCVNPHLVNRNNAWKAKRENALRRGGVYGKIITEAHLFGPNVQML